MSTAFQSYRTAGLQRILGYKQVFHPAIPPDDDSMNRFVNLFCEYQLADNNYMNLHLDPRFNKDDAAWFGQLSVDQVLQLITYIIWTDKFVPGYLRAKITDNSLYRLLDRLDSIPPGKEGTSDPV